MSAAPGARRALFRVVRGKPSDAELVALTVALAAAAGPPGPAAGPVPPDRWSDPAARLRGPLVPGPGAWQRTHWPR